MVTKSNPAGGGAGETPGKGHPEEGPQNGETEADRKRKAWRKNTRETNRPER